jgi:hypothetical protein
MSRLKSVGHGTHRESNGQPKDVRGGRLGGLQGRVMPLQNIECCPGTSGTSKRRLQHAGVTASIEVSTRDFVDDAKELIAARFADFREQAGRYQEPRSEASAVDKCSEDVPAPRREGCRELCVLVLLTAGSTSHR